MERRAILAAVLMAALLIAYQTFFLVPSEQPAPDQAPQPAPPVVAPSSPAPPAASPAPAQDVTPRPPTGPRPPQRLAKIESPLYRAVVSSEGGKLQEFTLHYRGDKPMVVLGELGPAGLIIESGGTREVVPLELGAERMNLSPGQAANDLALTGAVDGLRIRYTLRFEAERFVIGAGVRIENTTGTPRAVIVSLPWSARQTWKDVAEKFPGQHPTEVAWRAKGTLSRVVDLSAVGDQRIDGEWVAIGSTWYLTALVPRTPGFALRAWQDGKPGDGKGPAGLVSIAAVANPTIQPGQAWEGQLQIYVGPKEYDRLRAIGLEETINFGGFPLPRQYGGLPMEWLGVPILRLMNWTHDHVVRNYGVAIILLTVVSKILFFPLTIKSMKSMKGMQALAPQINALRSKYKSDPQRLQRETMELYRQQKVNPMGGCLPMLAQVPIFYALYLALSVSVELQNAPFLCVGRLPSWVPLLGGIELWICDLAGYDPTYILPILMGISMFVQQKMTPTMGDPRQARMMLIMPFVFTFMFLQIASGLVLYWFFSNVLQILQQKWMDRARPQPKASRREAKNAARA